LLAPLGWGVFVLLHPATAIMDSSGRVVTAGILVFVLPGLFWGQALRIRAVHPLDALAKATSLSVALGLVLALIVFSLRTSITHWAALLLAASAAGALLALRGRHREPAAGLLVDLMRGGRRDPISTAAFAGAISVMAVGLYRMADSPAAVGWEVGLQLGYIRQYASGLSLDPKWCALRPEPSLQLPNRFFLWEFLLAGVSRLSGMDPLVAALRSRWLVPALGLPALFSMMLYLFRSRVLAAGAFAVALVLFFSGFMFLPPSPLVDVGGADPRRGLTAFAGSIHHSDTAMEILLPLQVATLFRFLSSGRRAHLAALAAMLVTGFFWHPREYFQVMWYGVVAGVVLLVLGSRRWSRRQLVRRTMTLAAAFLVVTAVLGAAAALGRPGALVSGEMAAKSALLPALTSARVLFGSYTPFNAPYMGYGSPLPDQPYVYSWMALSAVAMIPLVLFGPRQARFVVAFYGVLWFATLCWWWSQVLLVILTYSEILVASMRFLHLFAVAVIGAGTVVAAGALLREARRRAPDVPAALVSALAGLALGLGFAVAWWSSRPGFRLMGPALSATAATATALAFARAGRAMEASPRPATIAIAAGTFLAFVAPSWVASPAAFVPRLVTPRSEPAELLSRSPLGLSSRMIRFLRERVPPREIVLVDPLGTHLLGIYAPVYVRPYPVGYVIQDLPEIQQAREGQHPLFRAPGSVRPDDDASAVDYVTRTGARWILGGPPHDAAMLEALAAARPALFEVVVRTGAGEVLLHVTRNP